MQFRDRSCTVVTVHENVSGWLRADQGQTKLLAPLNTFSTDITNYTHADYIRKKKSDAAIALVIKNRKTTPKQKTVIITLPTKVCLQCSTNCFNNVLKIKGQLFLCLFFWKTFSSKAFNGCLKFFWLNLHYSRWKNSNWL